MNLALLLSGGRGSRIPSQIPKQYIHVGDEMIITRSLRCLLLHPMIDAVWVVAAEEYRDIIMEDITASIKKERGFAPEDQKRILAKLRGFSKPGFTRSLSIYGGLMELRGLAEPRDIILVHDAARPQVSRDLITSCFMACATHEGAMPVLPMKDTVYESVNGQVISRLLERKNIYAGQAPEAFVYGKYLESYRRLSMAQIEQLHGSTEPAIMAGMDIAMIPGEENNYKITTAEDLERYRGQEA